MIFGLVPRRLTGGDKDYYDGTMPFAEWFENLERVVHTAEAAGFKFMAISQMQGLTIMARMAAIPTKLRFVNETLTLPMLDPVQLAPAAAYVDQMLEGRLDLGVSIGYRPWDLQAAGITRKDRVPKFVESIEIIKRMWTQDEVEFHGKYFDFEQLKPLGPSLPEAPAENRRVEPSAWLGGPGGPNRRRDMRRAARVPQRR